MDVLSLEHHFGKEVETSFHQLFSYFCNNINLGQWQMAKACLKQLDNNKKLFKTDFRSLLAEIIENPQLYCNGSQTLQSPYYLALLLYEYCQEIDIPIRNRDEKFYDRILVKSILYSVIDETALSSAHLVNQISVPSDQQPANSTQLSAQMQAVINELVDLLRPNLFPQLTNRITTTLTSTADKLLVTHNIEPAASSTTSSSSLYESITVTAISTSLPGPKTIMDDSRSSSVVVVSSSDPDEQISVNLFEFLKNVLLKHTLQAKKLFEIIFKYNPNSQHTLLKALLSAIDKTVGELAATDSASSNASAAAPAASNPQPIASAGNNSSGTSLTSTLPPSGATNPVSRRRSINANASESVVSQNQTRKTTLYALLNMLSIFKFFHSNERLQTQASTSSSNLLCDNKKYESIALIQRCFKNLCEKFNMLWSHNLDDLEDNYRMIYACFLQFDDQDSTTASVDSTGGSTTTMSSSGNSAATNRPSTPGSVTSVSSGSQSINLNLFDLFTKVHYDIDRHHTVSLTMINNEVGISNNYLVYSLVRQYSGVQKKNHLWRRLFMYCYMENKILLRCLIDECTNMILKNQYDYLSTIFSVKEFLNLKPLILLIGISKVQDIQSAKRLISCLCLNSDKGTLTEKLGKLLKTHIDFISWFQQIKPHNRKKEIQFSELVRLLHKQLPINLISQYIDLNKLSHAEMTKILRNTLTEKDNELANEKTKWVRFVDEVNEKITIVQEACLAIYNGYYCINEILNTILYCCEHINKKIYSKSFYDTVLSTPMTHGSGAPPQRAKSNTILTYTSANTLTSYASTETPVESLTSEKQLQNDYMFNVIEKLEIVKKILNEITPMNFRLELLENIYSLIFLSVNDLKESEEDEETVAQAETAGLSRYLDEAMNLNSDLLGNNQNGIYFNLNDQEVERETANVITEDNATIDSYDILNSNELTMKPDNHEEQSIYAASSTTTAGSKLQAPGSNNDVLSDRKTSMMRHYSSGTGGGVGGIDVTSRSYYRLNSNSFQNGGGGSFLVNDFLCRDLLLLLKEMLQAFSSSSASRTTSPSSSQSPVKRLSYSAQNDKNAASFSTNSSINCSITNSNDLNKRSSKLQKLVNESLWRFQLIKCDLVQFEYGVISERLFDSELSNCLVNQRQETLVYELMKKRRKRNASNTSTGNLSSAATTTASTPFSDSYRVPRQEAAAEKPRSHLQHQQRVRDSSNSDDATPSAAGSIYTRESKLKKPRASTISSVGHQRRRSIESNRSLSIIYPSPNGTHNANLTIMKLLADVSTLSAICLKEFKISEANQLVKMYAGHSASSSPSINKTIAKSFEFRQILFYDIYAQTLDDLTKLNEKQNENQKRQAETSELSTDNEDQHQTLIEQSLQSLELAKLTDRLLSFEKESNDLVKAIFLCDLLVASKTNLMLSSNLADYARIKLNRNITNESSSSAVPAPKASLKLPSKPVAGSLPSNEDVEDGDDEENDEPRTEESKRKELLDKLDDEATLADRKNEMMKLENDIQLKLSLFIDACQSISTHFVMKPANEANQSLTLIDYLRNFDGISISQLSMNMSSAVERHDQIQLMQNSIEKYESYKLMKDGLNSLKLKFEEELLKNALSQAQLDEIFMCIMNLVNESIRLNENEDLISTFFYKRPPLVVASSSSHTQLTTQTSQVLNDASNGTNVDENEKSAQNDSSNEDFMNTSIEKLIYKNIIQKSSGRFQAQPSTDSSKSSHQSNSNYLLSFREYCRTLFEYFREKSQLPSSVISNSFTTSADSSSFFSILNFSPASLICKLLFEESIKPQLLESLTQKLNLNLTAIILHNSCPRLKLTLRNRNQPLILSASFNGNSNNNQIKSLTSSYIALDLLISDHTNDNTLINQSHMTPLSLQQSQQQSQTITPSAGTGKQRQSLTQAQPIVDVYNLNSFYTILNETDIACCSRKKADEFVRDLLLKLLKFFKRYLSKQDQAAANLIQSQSQDQKTPKASMSSKLSGRRESKTKNERRRPSAKPQFQQVQFNQQFIDLKTARGIYECAEFKSILNESQELQHINLTSLQNDNQKLSFFINLYNLLSIHGHFYLAATSSIWKRSASRTLVEDEEGEEAGRSKNAADEADDDDLLFNNSTEKLLFEQRMCYKVGQMGCVSLYDIKHFILTRRCLNSGNYSFSLNDYENDASDMVRQSSSSAFSSSKVVANKSACLEPLFKYAFYSLDQDAEPLWAPFMPSESVCDYRILFALNNCLESDPPICVYNSDSLLNDQLLMQMRLFLNETIHVDTRNDILYLPSFLVENCSFFSKNVPSTLLDLAMLTAMNSNQTTNYLENLITFLVSQVKQDLRHGLKKLIDLDSVSGHVENIDQYGRKELPFPIVKILESKKFSLVIDSDHGGLNYSNANLRNMSMDMTAVPGWKEPSSSSSSPPSGQSSSSWYKSQIRALVKQTERAKKQTSPRADNLNESIMTSKSGDLLSKEHDDSGHPANTSQNTSNNTSAHSSDSSPNYDIKMEPVRQASRVQRLQLNKDCLDYIQTKSPLISNSLSFLFDAAKRNEFFQLLHSSNDANKSVMSIGEEKLSSVSLSSMASTPTLPANTIMDSSSGLFKNSLSRFIQLYVPLDYMKHLNMQTKLNLVTQFLLTNKSDESKIELIIDLANYYAQKQDWSLVISLLNNCTQDNEELNDMNSEFLGEQSSSEIFKFTKMFNANATAAINNENLLVNSSSTAALVSNSSNNLAIKSDHNGRYSQKDLYNLYDHACICQAYLESKSNETSFVHLFKMKNFLKQIRAIFGLMHLWPINSCLEMIDFCITKAKLFESTVDINSAANSNEDQKNLLNLLNDKKDEFVAYKELTQCARLTLEKYFDYQQMQDELASVLDPQAQPTDAVNTSSMMLNQSLTANDLSNLNKMKRVCQKCLTWQFAKRHLETSSLNAGSSANTSANKEDTGSTSTEDHDETNELIMDLFLLNEQFKSAKFLIKKLKLSSQLQFKVDFGHLKHRLLNLSVSSSILVIDFEAILKECISFASNSSNPDWTSSAASETSKPTDYVFDICHKLLNEIKDLNELNNQVLISLCDFLLTKYNNLLNEQQTQELRTLHLTARIFQILVSERGIVFDSYKRHHSNPLYIIEQLLMNSHIDLCSKAIKMCRDSINDPAFHAKINQTLVRYARKALEFRVYVQKKTDNASSNLNSSLTSASNLPPSSAAASSTPTSTGAFHQRQPSGFSTNTMSSSGISLSKKRSEVSAIDMISSSTSGLASSPPVSASSLSSSFKNFYKFASSSNANSYLNNNLLSLNTPPNPNSGFFASSMNYNNVLTTSTTTSTFVMPAIPPAKEDWVKDEDVNECMVCNTRRFSLLNRRHHCRRCGRVVCSNCSKHVTLIDTIPKRTCDDCFHQIEMQKQQQLQQQSELENSTTNDLIKLANGIKRVSLKPNNQNARLSTTSEFLKLGGVVVGNQTDANELVRKNSRISSGEESNNGAADENICWQLMGGNENETSKKRDEEIRKSFRYQQAPSTSLCLSILDFHDQPLECGKDLLSMCDDLSSFLQTSTYQVEDFALIINMIKHLLHNAKVKLLQNSSTNIISLCDTYLSLIDVLEQLLLANCAYIPSLYELRNTESVRRIRNRLLEEERHELAMNLSTKCGLDTQTVWASWGVIELKRGNYKEARTKFEKCLKPIIDKQASINTTQLKILTDVINYLENAPPIRMMGPQTLLSPLRSVEALIAEPKLFSIGETNMDDIQFKESFFYLDAYGNHSLIVAFYQRHNYLERALQYLIDNKCNSDIFVESLLVPALKSGEFYKLIEIMMGMDRIQSKLYTYYAAIGKYLEKNAYLNTLYDFQLLMKDYVRACMSCICFFTRNCSNYVDLYNNLNHLNKARKHLEEYMEICSIKQFGQTGQQQYIPWKQKPEQQGLLKQMTAPEVDNYLNAINLQIEVTKFIYSCSSNLAKRDQILQQKTPTLFGSNDTKINVCCLILLSGRSIQEGFGFVIRIIQCFNLNSTLVYSQIARELAKQYNFKEIHNLLKCINESGYKDEINASYDECISTCIRVFANSSGALNDSTSQQQQLQQQYNKEIEDLIQLIKNDENKINAYILNGRLKSAYLIAIKIDRVDIVKHIANVADRIGQNLIKDICNKWLEKKVTSN